MSSAKMAAILSQPKCVKHPLQITYVIARITDKRKLMYLMSYMDLFVNKR